ncbi:MAG TPA: carboxypeptidase-like regulatory domain-containing protein [Anaeromyxobacteraceae bacterium]|nr:carboxypeptidase-like regulatory domain-containing protein [Anaeromyxobacteraceae bacterium]
MPRTCLALAAASLVAACSSGSDPSAGGRATIAGRATLAGAGLAGVTVTAGGLAAVTDGDGRYAVSGLAAGTYAVGASAPSTVERAVSVTVAVDANGRTTAPDLRFTPAGAIAGTARLGSGAAGNAGIAVVVEGTTALALTDDAGRFALGDVPAGTYTVRAAFGGFRPAAATGVIVTYAQTTEVPALTLASVPGGAGSPLAEVAGSASIFADPDPSGIAVALDGSALSTSTAADGSFALADVPAGMYDATLSRGRFVEHVPRLLALPGATGFIVDGDLFPVGAIEIPRAVRIASRAASYVLTRDRARVVFTAPDASTGVRSLYLANVDGAALRQLATGISEPNVLELAPDEAAVLVASFFGAVETVSLVTGARAALAGNSPGWAWSPDGDHLLVLDRTPSGTRLVAAVPRDGTTVELAVQPGLAFATPASPGEVPGVFDPNPAPPFTAGGSQVLLYRDFTGRDGTLELVPVAGGAPKVVAQHVTRLVLSLDGGTILAEAGTPSPFTSTPGPPLQLTVASALTGAVTASLDAVASYQLSPDGSRLVAGTGLVAGATFGSAPTYALSVVDLARGTATQLAAGAHWHAVTPGGRILFMGAAAQPIPAPFEGGDLFTVGFDGLAPLRLAAGALWCAPPGTVTGPTPPPATPVTISADGSRIAFLAGATVDAPAAPPGVVSAHWSLAIALAGAAGTATTVTTISGTIFVGGPFPLTCGDMTFTPDAAHLFFQDGVLKLAHVAGGAPVAVGQGEVPPAFSPDGARAFHRATPSPFSGPAALEAVVVATGAVEPIAPNVATWLLSPDRAFVLAVSPSTAPTTTGTFPSTLTAASTGGGLPAVLSTSLGTNGVFFGSGFTTSFPDIAQGGVRFAPDGASVLLCEDVVATCPPACSGPVCRLVSAALAGGAPAVLSTAVPPAAVIHLPAVNRYVFVGDVSGTFDPAPVGVLRAAPPGGPALDLLPPTAPVESFAAAPDGRRIVAVGRGELVAVDAGTGSAVALAHDATSLGFGFGGSLFGASFSPTGAKLAYASGSGATASWSAVSLAGGPPTRLTRQSWTAPQWVSDQRVLSVAPDLSAVPGAPPVPPAPRFQTGLYTSDVP